jgi:uncharacterized membrane protein
MQIDNPLIMNDWDIKEFLKAILIIQIAIYGVIVLDSFGLHAPLLRPLIAFVYLTFVPGMVLLRALKLHKLGCAQTVLYAVGLSITTVMFTGFCINVLYPLLGIKKPIALVPLVVTLTVVVLLLCIVAYVRDREFRDHGCTSGITLSAPFLFLSIIPFLAIFGTYLLNFYQNNAVQLLLILIIALLVFLMVWSRFIPDDLYLYAVFVIALTLLYHGSLISTYLAGWDIFQEYMTAAQVLSNGIWDPALGVLNNSSLSLAMLAPIMASVSGLTLVQVFKVIYPLFYALVPVGLYVMYKRMTDARVALLAVFLFMAFFTFYLEMVWLAKEEIAQLFLILSLLVLTDRQMNSILRSGLLIVFGFSMIVAHYSTAYFYMFLLLSAWLIWQLEDSFNLRGRLNLFRSPTKEQVAEKVANNRRPQARGNPISFVFILLFLVLSFAWYINLAGSISYIGALNVLDKLSSTTLGEFLNPTASQGLQLLTAQLSGLHAIAQYLQYIALVLIVIGFVLVFSKRIKMKFERPYSSLAAMSLILLVAAVLVPHVASTLSTSRIYHLCLIFVAPFAVFGGIAIYKWACGLRHVRWNEARLDSSLKLMSVFFVVYLLFNSGFVYAIAHEPNASAWLTGTLNPTSRVYSDQDVAGGVWLNTQSYKDPIRTDENTFNFLSAVLGKQPGYFYNWTAVASGEEHVTTPSYMFFIASKNPDINLQATNTVQQPLTNVSSANVNSVSIFANTKVIYDNGDVTIYY